MLALDKAKKVAILATLKRCPSCTEYKEFDLFSNDGNRGCGKSIYCKVCQSEKAKTRYNKDIDKSRASKRKQAEKFKVRNNNISRKWYQNNKERVNANVKKYKSDNPVWAKKYSKTWAENNIDKVRANRIKYFKTEKGILQHRHQQHIRKARLRGAAGSHTLVEWNELKFNHDNRCLGCGLFEPEIKLTRDHIMPVSKGGSNYIENIQPLCARCNSKKHNNDKPGNS